MWYLCGKILMPNLVPSFHILFQVNLGSTRFFCCFFCFYLYKYFFSKFLRSNLTIMAPPKLSSNFKYKALFGYRFLTFALEPSTFESPPFEALNDFHSSSNPNVASFSNTIIVKIIVNLEDPKWPKIHKRETKIQTWS